MQKNAFPELTKMELDSQGELEMENKGLCRLATWLAIAAMLSVSSPIFAEDASGIEGFKPVPFQESAAKPFFYSIGKELRYGVSIGEGGTSVFKAGFFGNLDAVYPSPDEKKALVISENKLFLVSPGRQPKEVLSRVYHLDPESVSNQIYYEHPLIQWGVNSDCFYIPEFFRNGNRGEWESRLVMIDISSFYHKVVSDDFQATAYFFIGSDHKTICYNHGNSSGDNLWRCAVGGNFYDVASLSMESVTLANGASIISRPFISDVDTAGSLGRWFWRFKFHLKSISPSEEVLQFGNNQEKEILRIKNSITFKGNTTNGVLNGTVLPGGRYALLDVFEQNYTGQLLVDSITLHYKILPKQTNVYRSLTSLDYSKMTMDTGLGPLFTSG